MKKELFDKLHQRVKQGEAIIEIGNRADVSRKDQRAYEHDD